MNSLWSFCQNAIINMVGDVIAGGVKIVPYTCSHDNLPTVPNEYPQSAIYREVGCRPIRGLVT